MTETSYLYQYFLKKSEEAPNKAQNIPKVDKSKRQKREKKVKVTHES